MRRRLMVAVTLLPGSSGPAGADGENWLRSLMAVVSRQHSTSPCRISEDAGKSVGCWIPLLIRLAMPANLAGTPLSRPT
jgi:hypothetical protein